MHLLLRGLQHGLPGPLSALPAGASAESHCNPGTDSHPSQSFTTALPLTYFDFSLLLRSEQAFTCKATPLRCKD